MANIKSPVAYAQLYDKRRKMRRTAPPEGGSRIPVYGQSSRHQSAPQPSRLEQMQAKYRENVIKEKEEKMIQMFEKQQEQALRKAASYSQSSAQVPKKGIVRDFFRERREMAENQSEVVPSAVSHFQRMKSQKDGHGGNVTRNQQQKTTARQSANQKPGVSRSRPLPPLNRSTTKNPYAPPSPEGHFETSENIFEDDDDEEHVDPEINQRTNTFKKDFKGNKQKASAGMKSSRLPKIAPRGASQNLGHRGSSKSHPPPRAKQEQLSDFQKWQLEQDKKRDDRLQQYEEKLKAERQQKGFTGSFDSEDNWRRDETMYTKAERAAAHDRRQQEYDDIRRKEKELEELIARRQAELSKYDESDHEEKVIGHSFQQKTDRKKPSVKKGAKLTVQKPRFDENHNQFGTSNTQQRYSSPSNDDDMYIDTDRSGLSKGDRDNHQQESRSIQNKSKGGSQQKAVPKQYKPPAKYTQNQKPKPKQQIKQEEYISPFANFYEDSNDVSFYEQAAEQAGDEEVRLSLAPCPSCGRKFAKDRLPKHMKACKTSSKPRKVFDMTKQRTQGTEAAQYVKKGQHLKEPKQVKNADWRRKHEEFQQTVREARKIQAYVAKGGNLADLPPPPPSENPDYKQCPHCKRKFNPTAAERHIPKCKDIKSRPAPVKRR